MLHNLSCVCFRVSDTLLPTTHLAPRSLCMRRTARWQHGSRGCGRSLTRWEWGERWREYSLSMNTGCLMSYCCNWEQLSSNCESLMFRGLCKFFPGPSSDSFISLLQARRRIESWRRWSGGSETPDDWGSYIITPFELLVPVAGVNIDFCLDVRSSDGRMEWSRTGWLTTA